MSTKPSAPEAAETTEDATEPKVPLNLTVKVDQKSACERHLTVTISKEDVAEAFGKALGELIPEAQVPGFRVGRAPRKLVEHRFQKEVSEQVKATLLMRSMEQISEEQKLAAISEPDLDLAAVTVDADGPLTFEFDIEVRPEFDLPKWKGLTIEKPVHEFTDADVNERLEQILGDFGRLIPKEDGAKLGDYLTVNMTFKNGEEVVSTATDIVVRIRPTLSLRDGRVEEFDKLMVGAKPGESRAGSAKISSEASNESLRDKTVQAVFDVQEVKRLQLPELTPELLKEIGDYASEAELRDVARQDLERQLKYRQSQQARKQITSLLTAAANWELPPDMLRRQAVRELERSVLELRRSGFAEDMIRAHENDLRQNSLLNTARSLKEHFILERIAEEEKIEEQPSDYDDEIALIAGQSGESERRVRAHLEKRGLMDVLRNQIIERKVIDLVLSHAKFKEVPFKAERTDVEAIDAAAGGEEAIPDAQPDGGASFEAAKAEKKLS